MGYKTKFNWLLKLKPEQGLNEGDISVGKEYKFTKDNYRTFPVDIPIYLVNKDWQAIGMATIKEYTVGNEKTTGIYKVTKIFDDEQRNIISKTLR